jgi:hypothetical protein
MTKLSGLHALFISRLAPREACQKFLQAFQRHQPRGLVRLTKAVHMAISALIGIGQGGSCVVPG